MGSVESRAPLRGLLRRHWVTLGLASFYLTAALLSPNIVGLYHDDGIYVGTALSLARGEGYRIPHLPGAPLQAKYPPLFPLLLTPIAAATGGDPSLQWALRWPSVLCALAALALLPGLLRRWGFPRGAADAVTALSGLSPLLFQHAMLALSEPPYLLLTIGALRLMPGEGERFGRGRAIALGAAAAGAVLCRSIGIALLPALVVFAWRRRREAAAWMPFAGTAVAAAAWIAASGAMGAREAARGLGPLYDYYLGYGIWVQTDPSRLARVVAANALSLVRGAGDGVLGWLWIGGRGLPWSIVLIAMGLAALAGIAPLTRRSRPAAVYLLASLGLILVWPFDTERFLIPLTPLLVAALVLSYRWVAARLHLPPAVGMALAGLALVSVLGVDLARFPTPGTLHALHYRFDVAAYGRAAAWIRDNTRPDDVIVSDHDPWLYLATGRKGLPPGRFDPLWIYGATAGDAVRAQAEEEHTRYKARWILATRQWDEPFQRIWFPRFIADREAYPRWYEEDGIWIFGRRPATSR